MKDFFSLAKNQSCALHYSALHKVLGLAAQNSEVHIIAAGTIINSVRSLFMIVPATDATENFVRKLSWQLLMVLIEQPR